MDERKRMTTAKRSLDVVLHLLPQASRDVREIFRYALTTSGTAPEEEAQFAHQEVLLSKFHEGMEAMHKGLWGLADKHLQEVISESEKVRATIEKDLLERDIKKLHNALNGIPEETPPREDSHNGEEK